IAAVVPRPAHNGDVAAFDHLHRDVRDRTPGGLHQRESGDPDVFDRRAIECAHLRSSHHRLHGAYDSRVLRWVLIACPVIGCGRGRFADTPDVPVPPAYRDAVLGDGPLDYWRLGDTGAVAVDQTGRNDGSYAGACTHGRPGAIAGDADAATLFDGMSC